MTIDFIWMSGLFWTFDIWVNLVTIRQVPELTWTELLSPNLLKYTNNCEMNQMSLSENAVKSTYGHTSLRNCVQKIHQNYVMKFHSHKNRATTIPINNLHIKRNHTVRSVRSIQLTALTGPLPPFDLNLMRKQLIFKSRQIGLVLHRTWAQCAIVSIRFLQPIALILKWLICICRAVHSSHHSEYLVI